MNNPDHSNHPRKHPANTAPNKAVLDALDMALEQGLYQCTAANRSRFAAIQQLAEQHDADELSQAAAILANHSSSANARVEAWFFIAALLRAQQSLSLQEQLLPQS